MKIVPMIMVIKNYLSKAALAGFQIEKAQTVSDLRFSDL
jgi:hypothetical protein